VKGARPLIYGILIAVFVLCGRWGIDRMLSSDTHVVDALVIYELRFWVVCALAGAVLLQPRHGAVSTLTKGLKGCCFALVFFIIYRLLTALWAPDAAFAARKAWDLVLLGVATVCLYDVVAGPHGAAARRAFWTALIVIAGSLAALALVKSLSSGGERMAVLGGGPNVFGRMMGLLLLAVLRRWRRRGNVFLMLLAVLSVVLLLLSGSRGSIVAAGVAIPCFILIDRVKFTRAAAGGIAAALIFAILALFTSVGKNAVAAYEQRIAKLLLKEGYTAGRTDLYRAGIQLGSDEPVLGAGLNVFPALDIGAHPHNFFLEIFCEGGVVGLFSFVPCLFLFLRRCIQTHRSLDGATAAAFVFILTAAQFSGDLYDSRSMFVFMMMAYLPREAGS
jgi:O-antigen ligase